MWDVYVPVRADGFELCRPVNRQDSATIDRLINGKRRSASWHPVVVRLIGEHEGRKLLPSDSPWFGSHALIFGPTARDALGAELHRFGEHLPLECATAELVVYNPVYVVDGLDEDRSVVERTSDGQIRRIVNLAFRTREIVGLHVFKLLNVPVSPTFVTGRVVELWTQARLGGLEFRKVWSPQQRTFAP